MPDVPARWSLPDHPRLSWLRKRAKRLRRRIAAGDAEALDLLDAYDPPRPGSGPVEVPLARAQRVLARAHGFAGWSALKAHVDTIDRLSRSPRPAGRVRDADPADAFLRLACLTYTAYGPEDRLAAEAMLAERPDLATASVWTLAATGRADDLAVRLTADPALANAEGGPHRWAPLVYLAYARLGASRGDPVGAVRVLLDAGADPDAGFLWQGLTSPFTVLTGAFGGGERGEPPHPDGLDLARLLLDRGADPNDNQTLYDRMFTPDDRHLELLLAYGLGQDRPSVWRQRLGADAYPSAAAMLGEQLRYAAQHGFAARARLLLAHGVDPDTTGYHPLLGDATPYELAVTHGHPEVAALLAATGARPGRVDEVDRYVAALLAGEPGAVTALRARPDLAQEAVRRRPGAVQLAVELAVEQGREAAVERLLAAGFDVDGTDRFGATGLHQAALDGREDVVELLLEHGADRTRRDRRFDATPAGWARHAGHDALADRLESRSTEPHLPPQGAM